MRKVPHCYYTQQSISIVIAFSLIIIVGFIIGRCTDDKPQGISIPAEEFKELYMGEEYPEWYEWREIE